MSVKYEFSKVFGDGNLPPEQNSQNAFELYTKIFNLGVNSIDGDPLSHENVYDAIMLIQDLSRLHNKRGGLAKVFGGGGKEGKMVDLIKNNLQDKGIDKKIMADLLSEKEDVVKSAMGQIEAIYPKPKVVEKKKVDPQTLIKPRDEDELESAFFTEPAVDEGVNFVPEEEGRQFDDDSEPVMDTAGYVDEELELTRKGVIKQEDTNQSAHFSEYDDEDDSALMMTDTTPVDNTPIVDLEDTESEEQLRELEEEDEKQ